MPMVNLLKSPEVLAC